MSLTMPLLHKNDENDVTCRHKNDIFKGGTTATPPKLNTLIIPLKEEVKRKGKILMIHGWAQNAKVFCFKTKNLARKLSMAGYECIYLEAPFLLPMTSMVNVEGNPVEIVHGKRENARAWFYYSDIDRSDATLALSEQHMKYIGLEESVNSIGSFLRLQEEEEKERRHKNSEGEQLQYEQYCDDGDDDNDNFCAVLGFSQGAVFAHVLACLSSRARLHDQKKKESTGSKFRDTTEEEPSTTEEEPSTTNKSDIDVLLPFRKIDCVILASGFPAMHGNDGNNEGEVTPLPQIESLSTHQIAHILSSSSSIYMPSLHLIGRSDTSVVPNLSLKLASKFFDGQLLLHDKGHTVPQKSAQSQEIIAFLDKIKETG